MFRTCCLALAALTLALVSRSPAEEPSVSKTYLGSVVGTVVKVDSDSITIKVATPVQTGVTSQRSGNRTIQVPKYTTKQIESTYALSAQLVVKTIAGKTAKLDDVKPGGLVELHGYNVKEYTPGEKAVTHFEVRRINVPNPTSTTTPAPTTSSTK